jgi:hypothetical protein
LTGDLGILLRRARTNALDAIALVEASLQSLKPYDPTRPYSPEQREPYDALCDRFVRALETCFRFFRTWERVMYGENSETLRDLLLRAEKLHLTTSVRIWMDMREARNRIAHEYLPDQLRSLYDLISGPFAAELRAARIAISNVNITDDER